MNKSFFENHLGFLLFQRNFLLSISFLLAIALIVLTSFLFFKQERIVIVPPVVEKEFWVDYQGVSPTYLEQFGYFLSQLLLAKSPQSASNQRTVLLRHVDPSYAGILKKRLIEEEEQLKKQNASYVFYPVDIKIDPKQMSLLLIGDRQIHVSGKEISSARESYLLRFSYSGSRLLLKEVITEGKS